MGIWQIRLSHKQGGTVTAAEQSVSDWQLNRSLSPLPLVAIVEHMKREIERQENEEDAP